MHLVGRTATYNNVITRNTWPLLRPVQLTRNFACSSRSLAPVNLSGVLGPRPVPNPLAKEVAILGGGITGLSTAYNISQCLPHAKITIYEAGDRLGGWMNSEVVQVDNGEVLFEWGPRTLRPALGGSGQATLDLLAKLDLYEDIVPTDKKSPAALNRYIYYPDHLTRMPGPVPGITEAFRRLYATFTEPIFDGVLKALIREPTVPLRDENLQDESVGDFLERRFGKNITDNIASAFFHGIYAGDLYKLSARTLLPLQWFLETKDDSEGSGVLLEFADMMLKGYRIYPRKNDIFAATRFAMQQIEQQNQFRIAPLLALLSSASVYTLERGLGGLVSKLEGVLTQNSNVIVQKQNRVTAVNFNKGNDKLTVHVDDQTKGDQYDYVVSSLAPNAMGAFLDRSAQSRGTSLDPNITAACKHSHRSVSVMVVNLYYSNPALIPPSLAGFGYLIPRSVPFEQNPERALGVIFGSETSGVRGPTGVETRQVSRRTVELSLEQLRTERDKLARQLQELADAGADIPSKVKEVHQRGLESIDEKMDDTKKTAAKWFKSDSSDEVAEIKVKLGQDSAPGTKLTIMMGGHWWDGWAESDLPNENEAITMANDLLQRHLNITDVPEVAKARLARECIPQYPIGYRKDMATIHEGLLSEYQGRFKVAGPWWQGAVGVNDCIRKARETVWAIREQWDDKTGLEEYTKDESWCIFHLRTGEKSVIGGASGS